MGTISSAFHIIASALDADQSALSIVANNVANANTAGYTREVPNWQENPPIEINGTTYGAGVTETGPTSIRDRVMEQRLAQQQQMASAADSRLTALNSLEALFTPSSGSSSSTAGDIGSDISSFFDSFSSLEPDPTNNSLRQQVLSSATALAGDIANTAASITSQQAALDQQAAGVVSQVNALTSAIAQLNGQIQLVSAQGNTGTLEDQRQQDILKLSQLVGVNQVTTENNGLSITTTAGQLLVSGTTSEELSAGSSGGVTHFYLGSADVTSELTSGGGQLGGYLIARDQDLPTTLSKLDQLAYYVSTSVNSQNNAGTDLAGDVGNAGNIFAQPGAIAGSARAIQVVMTDPNRIAAAASGAGTGDDGNAILLAKQASQSIVNGQTPANFYAQFVSTLGAMTSEADTENTALQASVTQLQTQINSLSGVNLNDEAASMQQFERSYQAASEVFAILNTIMASALNLGVQTAVS